MAPSPAGKSPRLFQFGVFEVDLDQGELRKNGRKIKLQDLPFQFLAALLERAGEVVTREELARRLWSGALVDFDSGLNTAARKLRDALDDDAMKPRYVETLPRRGYRFIAPVQIRHIHLAHPSPVAETPTELHGRPVSPRRRWWYLGVVAAAILPILAYRWSAPVRPPRVLNVVQLTRTGSVESANGVVTDGSRVYFTERNGGRWWLAQVSPHGGVSQPIQVATPLGGPDIFDISPDRASLLVAEQQGVEDESPLWVLPTVGGTPRRIGDARGHAGAWSRDGSRVVFARGFALFLVNSDGTDCRKLVDTPGLAQCIRWSPASQPDVLRFSVLDPDLRATALWEVTAGGAGLHLLLRKSNDGSRQPEGDNSGTWIAPGRLYLFRSHRAQSDSIWAMPENRGFGGGRRPVQIYSTPLQLTWLAAAPDGKRIFVAAGQEHRELVRYDSHRGQFLPYVSGVPGRWVAFSRDARWVAYTTAPQETLWRSRADGSDPVQLTSPNMRVYQPCWSPDGTHIAFGGAQIGQTSRIYVIPFAGGVPESVTPAPFIEGDVHWSPDGNTLAFARTLPPGVPGRAGLYAMDWRTRKTTFVDGSEEFSRVSWSPGQRYLAATSKDGTKIDLLDLETRQWTPLAAGAGLGVPFWSGDSQYVYYQEVLGDPEQPIFRVQIHNRKIEKMMSSSQIPQSNLTGYVMTGMAPGDEPIATVLRSNSDIYALDLELP